MLQATSNSSRTLNGVPFANKSRRRIGARSYRVFRKVPHAKQALFISSKAKRKVVRAGRRGGKTVGVAVLAVDYFLNNKRVLYAAPTTDQVDRFWTEVCRALDEPIRAGKLYKNETEHVIEVPGTEIRIRAKTAWNADMLRGDYADLLILDEFQIMAEAVWDEVGAPMLLDNNGDAVFIFTPPSLHSTSASKAKDPQHANKLFRKAQADTSGMWETFHFTSHDNPHISKEALQTITGDMTALAYRMEINAEDVDENPKALWKRATIEQGRKQKGPEEYARVVIAVDPSATSTGDEAGIIAAGKTSKTSAKGEDEGWLIEDSSVQASPDGWAKAAVTAYYKYKANVIVAEQNNGGEMVKLTIQTVDKDVPVKLVHASRGKQTRAEPVAAIYEQGRVHHLGSFTQLEDEQCLWEPGDDSPNRMDAAVWAFTELLVGEQAQSGIMVVGRR